MLQDAIEREITVRATKERVFQAITDPKQITVWFPNAIEGTLDVGESPVFDFGDGGRYRIFVEAVQPHEYFAYRWVPANVDNSTGFLGDVLARPNTLVEFRLEDVLAGTLVKLKESGFASLPAAIAEKSLGQNSGGWDFMLERLVKVFGQE